MARVLFAVICTLLTSTTLVGQDSSKPAAPSPSTQLSNEDQNIRAYIELLRSDVQKSKAQIMGEVMHFDADDATKFWPIYKEFQSELAKLGDTLSALIKKYAENYESMTDEIADQLANQLLDIERDRTDLKRKYYQRFKVALDPITAARFLQVENQLERVVDLQIAAQLPVIN